MVFKRYRKSATGKKVPKAVKSYVHKALANEIETKNISATFTQVGGIATGITNAGSMYSIGAVAQGINVNERTGNAITPRRMHIRVIGTNPLAGINNWVRVIILQSLLQTGVTLLTPAGVLATTAIVGETVVSPYNTAQISNKRFKVLYDKKKYLEDGVGGANQFNIVLRKNLASKIHYTGAAATDLGKGSLQMLFIADDVASANSPGAVWGTQLFYDDA